MKRIVLALVCLVLVLACAVLRPRLLPETHPLPLSPRGVTLVLVEGYSLQAMPPPPGFSAIGLMPTRNGTPDDSDFEAGVQMILTGSRSAKPNARRLPQIVADTRAPLTLLRFTGPEAVPQALAKVSQLNRSPGLPEGTSLLLVGVTPSHQQLINRERVAPVLFWSAPSNNRAACLLTSPSTRHRPGLIAATDIAATVATLLNLPQSERRIGDGRAIETLPPSHNANLFFLWQEANIWGLQAREQKLLPVLPWFLAGLVLLATFTPRDILRRVATTALLAIPVSLILVAFVPLAGFRALTFPPYCIYLLTAFLVSIFVFISLFHKEWGNRLPVFLAKLTFFVIALDTCTGGFLLSHTPLSYSVLEAARFYGIGNEVSGLFLGAALITIGTNQGRIATLWWGLTVAVISGAPTLGADAGGFVATILAFTMLAFQQNRTPSSPAASQRRIILLTSASLLLLISGFALWDGSRPATSRTHIGEAVVAVREKGVSSLRTMLTRKVSTNARLLFTSPWAILLLTEIAHLVWLQKGKARPKEVSLSRDVLRLPIGLLVGQLALFVLNDSGVVAGATCGLYFFCFRSDSQPSPENHQ